MNLSIAAFCSVVAVCLSGLVAWRWWLAHSLSVAQARLAETQAKVRELDKEWTALHALESRVKGLEYKTSGVGR